MIQKFTNIEDLSLAAAALFVELSKEAIREREKFSVVLTGGTTPKLMHHYLATKDEFLASVEWDKIHFFFGDERYVPYDDPRSNSKMAYDTLLDFVPVIKEQVYKIKTLTTPGVDALEYETLIKTFFQNQPPKFDLLFLGLGPDGHTASLFPGTEVLKPTDRWVKDLYLEAQTMYRITLTANLINNARNIVFLVSGKEKADALKEILEGEYNPELYPAQLIKPLKGKVHWYIDEDAGSKLSR